MQFHDAGKPASSGNAPASQMVLYHTNHRADRGRENLRCAVVNHDSTLYFLFSRVVSENQEEDNADRNSEKHNARREVPHGARQHDLTKPLMLTIFERSRTKQQRALTFLARLCRIFSPLRRSEWL